MLVGEEAAAINIAVGLPVAATQIIIIIIYLYQTTKIHNSERKKQKLQLISRQKSEN